jgi:hypothetical protein
MPYVKHKLLAPVPTFARDGASAFKSRFTMETGEELCVGQQIADATVLEFDHRSRVFLPAFQSVEHIDSGDHSVFFIRPEDFYEANPPEKYSDGHKQQLFCQHLQVLIGRGVAEEEAREKAQLYTDIAIAYAD